MLRTFEKDIVEVFFLCKMNRLPLYKLQNGKEETQYGAFTSLPSE